MQRITPFLWFDTRAEEAAKFYTSVFKNSKIGKIARYGKEGEKVSGKPANSVMTVAFKLGGQEFVALNGGPNYKFTPALSFVVNCKTQKEIDWYWRKLSQGGEEGPCGWLQDKYGLSWQIVPTDLPKLVGGPDPEKSNRVMKALVQMKKLNLAALKRAYQERSGS